MIFYEAVAAIAVVIMDICRHGTIAVAKIAAAFRRQ